MKSYKFEDLPEILGELFEKVSNIEMILLQSKTSSGIADDELLDVSQAAELLKLSVATVYTKVCKNEIPANKQGKRLYFYRSELLTWIRSGRIKTIAEIQSEAEIKFHSRKH